MCNLPAEWLEKQLLIESIPQIVLVLILFLATVLTLWWWFKCRLSRVYRQTALISYLLVAFVLWYKASFLLVNIGTNVFNTEYAGLVKYSQGCPAALKGEMK